MYKTLGRFVEALFVLLGVMLFVSRPAHAYIDAGTGSYFLQVAIGTIAGVAFSIKLFWQQIRNAVSARFTSKQSSQSSAVRRRP